MHVMKNVITVPWSEFQRNRYGDDRVKLQQVKDPRVVPWKRIGGSTVKNRRYKKYNSILCGTYRGEPRRSEMWALHGLKRSGVKGVGQRLVRNDDGWKKKLGWSCGGIERSPGGNGRYRDAKGGFFYSSLSCASSQPPPASLPSHVGSQGAKWGRGGSSVTSSVSTRTPWMRGHQWQRTQGGVPRASSSSSPHTNGIHHVDEDKKNKLKPSFREHKERLQSIQEKSAVDLKRNGTLMSRSSARMRYQQKMRQQVKMQEMGHGTMEPVPFLTTHTSSRSSSNNGNNRDETKDNRKQSTGSNGMVSSNDSVPAPVLLSMATPSVGARGDIHSSSTVLSSTRNDTNTTIIPPGRRGAVSSNPKSLTASSSCAAYSGVSDDDESRGESKFDSLVDDAMVKQIYKNEKPKDVHIVRSLEDAKRVAALLMQPGMEERTFACDTEVMGIDVARESPCCHGKVICFSLYCGSDIDFGIDDGETNRSMLWVDTWLDGEEGRQEEAKAILETFRCFFESDAHKKVWHNYSFDRHVVERMGIKCNGFYGDTMHMARLWDSSRTGRGGYSLEALTSTSLLIYFHIFVFMKSSLIIFF